MSRSERQASGRFASTCDFPPCMLKGQRLEFFFFLYAGQFLPKKNSRENFSELSRTMKQSDQQNQVWTLYFRTPVLWIGLKRCCPQGWRHANSSHLILTLPYLRDGYRTIWITLPVFSGSVWQQRRPNHQSSKCWEEATAEKKQRLSTPSQMEHLCPPLWS